MDNKECTICRKLTKEKYKHYNTWKGLAILFMCLTMLFAILYFATGDLVKTTVVEYDNEVVIENNGGNNTNTGNGNITVEKEESNTGVILVVVFGVLLGGFGLGYYIVSQKNNKNKE